MARRGAATLAVEVFVRRVRVTISASVASLGEPDTRVFGDGIGENAAPVRTQAGDGLCDLRVSVDEAAKRRGAEVGVPDTGVASIVLRTRGSG